METATTALDGGFADPVLDAQATFRAVMDAMAHPATVVRLRSHISPPAPLPPTLGAIACTLMDADTPVWLDPALGADAQIGEWLAFHTGAGFTDKPAEATFALAADAALLPLLDRFAQGTQEYPDRSATLVVRIDGFDRGDPLAFRGPGIRGEATISPRGLPADFARQWNENCGRFPRGIDLVLATADAIVCLPRTSRLAAGEA